MQYIASKLIRIITHITSHDVAHTPGREECPVGLLWHSGHGPNLDHFSTLEELHRVPCAVRLNVSAQNFVKEGSECPLTFQWRGDQQ